MHIFKKKELYYTNTTEHYVYSTFYLYAYVSQGFVWIKSVLTCGSQLSEFSCYDLCIRSPGSCSLQLFICSCIIVLAGCYSRTREWLFGLMANAATSCAWLNKYKINMYYQNYLENLNFFSFIFIFFKQIFEWYKCICRRNCRINAFPSLRYH